MNSMKPKPLMEGIGEVRTAEGKHKVRLEIPETSTLTAGEIDRILEAASWKTDPNEIADGLEGSRAILLRREEGIVKGGIRLAGLQVSGIGFSDHNMDNMALHGETLYPPSNANFMGRVTGTLMSTSYGEGTEIRADRPRYRALGTYTSSELAEKVRKTQEISGIGLSKLLVPHVEAYGRYIDEHLADGYGPFGFIVMPVPYPVAGRAINQFLQKLTEALIREGHMDEHIFVSVAFPYIEALSEGLRELHDYGRRAHLQTHLGNFYLLGGRAYLMDWGTMRRLEDDSEGNLRNRAIDLKRPTDDFELAYRHTYRNSPIEEAEIAGAVLRELAMGAYAGRSGERIDLLSATGGHERTNTGADVTEFDAMVLWMKTQGMEGHTAAEVESQFRKPGRNELCICGSGLKWKRCCGA